MAGVTTKIELPLLIHDSRSKYGVEGEKAAALMRDAGGGSP
jgi:hypothetical protein